MMRPMKVGGDQLMFGQGCLAHLETLQGQRAFIVTSGEIMDKNGILDKVQGHLRKAGIDSAVFRGVEPDPGFRTVMKGAEEMLAYKPDIIIALGGGSAMDAAKAMWIFYEHPELKRLTDIAPPNKVPKLRAKAIMVCIPSTAGTASEVSRSIVITDDDTHFKHGIGDMEMMPDIAICDPAVTASMPPHITADTGMDALTHALEALVSRRANFFSDILCRAAIRDIVKYLPLAVEDGSNLNVREKMLNASTIAGIAFTNVSLGIVHSMAHTLGSVFHQPHGLLNAVLLPTVMRFNTRSDDAKELYRSAANELLTDDLITVVCNLSRKVDIPPSLAEVIADRSGYMSRLDEIIPLAKADGCTKTNPVIPTDEQWRELFIEAYDGALVTSR